MPVVAVIVMVVFALLLGAGLYVWLDGFVDEDADHEQAAALGQGSDRDQDGDAEWIRLTLTRGENAPYDGDEVAVSVTDPTGAAVENVCKQPHAEAGTDCNSDPATATADEAFDFGEDSEDTWDVGEDLWVPCQAEGNHPITVSVAGTVILDGTYTCGASAS